MNRFSPSRTDRSRAKGQNMAAENRSASELLVSAQQKAYVRPSGGMQWKEMDTVVAVFSTVSVVVKVVKLLRETKSLPASSCSGTSTASTFSP